MMTTSSSVQRSDAVPLYHQLFLALRDDIMSGRRGLGSRLPTEHELAASSGVSRITARRALGELSLHNYVERRRRIGTVVTFAAPTLPIEANLDQAVESLISFGRNTRVEVIGLDEVPAPGDVATGLKLPPGTMVVRALRVRYLEDVPLGAIESHMPIALAADLTRERLTRVPMLELLRDAGHVIGSGRQTVSATVASPALAAMLATEPRAAIIRIDRIIEASDGTPLLMTTAQYRGDRYRLSLDLHSTTVAIAS